jgi:2-C-methyl-D-erythritol 2,4-cyclodiphosphate synthase
VEIEHSRGLSGHSDADVLVHAICDALLGAVAAGDLGSHFPDTDPAYAGIDSLKLLAGVLDVVRERGGRPGNVDASIIAAEPRLNAHLSAMRERLADALGLPADRVSVKATSPEGVGGLGRSEGIAVLAVCSVEEGAP